MLHHIGFGLKVICEFSCPCFLMRIYEKSQQVFYFGKNWRQEESKYHLPYMV